MGDLTGEADKGALRLDFDRHLLLQFRGSTITLRCRATGLPRAGRHAGPYLHGCRKAGGRAHRQGRSPPAGRPAASIGVRTVGRLRGRERRRQAVSRSGDALGGRRPRHHRLCRLGQSDRPVRDEVAEPPREPRRARRSTGPRIDEVHRRQPPKRIVLDMDSSESPPMASGQAAPTTATSAAPATTRCSSSTSSVTWSGSCCGGAIVLAPSTGGACCCR